MAQDYLAKAAGIVLWVFVITSLAGSSTTCPLGKQLKWQQLKTPNLGQDSVNEANHKHQI